jgi:hypothetical protein
MGGRSSSRWKRAEGGKLRFGEAASAAVRSMEGLDRRVSRVAPQARLRPGWLGFYPTILPDAWYPLHTAHGNYPTYIWLETSHGIIRVQRSDVELRDAP